jgi:hypothetical protein
MSNVGTYNMSNAVIHVITNVGTCTKSNVRILLRLR